MAAEDTQYPPLQKRLEDLAQRLVTQYKFSDQGFLQMTRPVAVSSIWEDDLSSCFQDELVEHGNDLRTPVSTSCPRPPRTSGSNPIAAPTLTAQPCRRKL